MPLHDDIDGAMMRLAASAASPPAGAPKTKVRRVTIHVPDRGLETTRVRGIGFRAADANDWKGPVRKTYAQARQDAREHRGASQ